MRRLIQIGVTSLLLLAILPFTSSGGPTIEVDSGAIFGGQWAQANMSATSTQNLSELPAIVEDYTATWCENCLEVEHALDTIEPYGLIQQYQFHRSIGETQDPFGTEVLDERWEERYGLRQPPTVVFNGTLKKVGSVPEFDSLEEDYSSLANQSLNLGMGSTTMTWTPTSDLTGTIAWSLTIEDSVTADARMNVSVWIVEASAEFEEGSNGKGIYPHIVREIIDLGSQSNGTQSIELPQPFDGDDLQIHLMYSLTPIVAETPVVIDPPVVSEETPALGILSSLAMCVIVAFCRREVD